MEYGTYYWMQEKSIQGLQQIYGMFRDRTNGRESVGSRWLGEECMYICCVCMLVCMLLSLATHCSWWHGATATLPLLDSSLLMGFQCPFIRALEVVHELSSGSGGISTQALAGPQGQAAKTSSKSWCAMPVWDSYLTFLWLWSTAATS